MKRESRESEKIGRLAEGNQRFRRERAVSKKGTQIVKSPITEETLHSHTPRQTPFWN
jgi:hypothetical protein